MINKIKTGSDGEMAAELFLKDKGYDILKRNYRYRKSEIDLIARFENWLIFIEVKTRSSSYFGYPEEFVDRAKQKMVFEGADHFIEETNWNGNVRYDILSVIMKNGKVKEVMHFEDAFY